MLWAKKELKAIIVIIVILFSSSLWAQKLDKRQLESGIAFFKEGKYQLALEDFNTVIKSFPNSPYADDAQLYIAKYYLQIAKDYERAEKEFSELISRYAQTDSAEAAYFYIGYIKLLTGYSPEQYNEALASFERIVRLYPGSQWVDDALLNLALTYERLRDYDRAIEKLNSLLVQYPQFEQISKAQLLKAKYYLYFGDYRGAIEELQRLRNKHPESSEAAKALKTLTLLYRLRIKPKITKEPIYKYDEGFYLKVGENIKDAKTMAINSKEEIFIGDGKRNAILKFSMAGDYLEIIPFQDPQGIFLDSQDGITLCNKKGVKVDQVFSLLSIKTAEGPKPIEEAIAVIKDSYNRYIVADKKRKTLLYFDKNLNYHSSLSHSFFRDFTSIAIDSQDNIWVLEEKHKSLKQFKLTGEELNTLMSKGRGYEFSQPIDISIDSCDNLYVLDKKLKKVYVFSPHYELLASFNLHYKDGSQPDNPLLIAVDYAGGIYIFDKKTKGLLRYF